MPFPVAAAALMLAPEVLKYARGVKQHHQAQEYQGWQRPQQEIPSAFTEYFNRARSRAGSGLPGFGQLQAKISGASAGTNRDILDSQSGGASQLLGLVGTDANTKQAISDLGIEDANFRNANELAYDQALREKGGWENTIWEQNQLKPYLAAMASASALENASIHNKQGAVEGAIGAVAPLLLSGNRERTDPLKMGDLPGNNDQPLIPRNFNLATQNPFNFDVVDSPEHSFQVTSSELSSLKPYNDFYMNVKQQYPEYTDDQMRLLMKNKFGI